MEVAILTFRIVTSVLLYIFLGAMFLMLWRDLKATRREPVVSTTRERPCRLRVVQGDDGLAVDQVVALTSFTTIGRSDSNAVVVCDPYASGEHALIAWRNGQWWLEDRGSRNGTLLNAIPIDEPLIISQGDVIGIGHVQFKFEYFSE